jgi:lysozyme
MRTLGAAGTALIRSFEKLELEAYLDQGHIPTIGWGHTGPEVALGQTCTVEQAGEWFVQDTQKAVNAVNASICVLLSPNQFDAVAAFTFNVGITAEGHSTLCKKVNTQDMAGAAAEFMKWVYVKGVRSAGLENRRAAERDLFLTP